MDDAQIKKIVGSRASWMMRWGILWAFAVFLCIYCVMYWYIYPYEKKVKGVIRLVRPGSNIVQLYLKEGGDLRKKEALHVDSIRISYRGNQERTVQVRRMLVSNAGYHLEYSDSAAFLTYKGPYVIGASLKISGMNLLDIIFKDVGSSVQRK